jgi:hypothetical protein
MSYQLELVSTNEVAVKERSAAARERLRRISDIIADLHFCLFPSNTSFSYAKVWYDVDNPPRHFQYESHCAL